VKSDLVPTHLVRSGNIVEPTDESWQPDQISPTLSGETGISCRVKPFRSEHGALLDARAIEHRFVA